MSLTFVSLTHTIRTKNFAATVGERSIIAVAQANAEFH